MISAGDLIKITKIPNEHWHAWTHSIGGIFIVRSIGSLESIFTTQKGYKDITDEYVFLSEYEGLDSKCPEHIPLDCVELVWET